MLLDVLSSGPGAVMLLVATLLVLAESALLVGVVMPGFGVPVAVGALSAAGAMPWSASAPLVCVAAALGRLVAFQRGRKSDMTPVPSRVRDVPLVSFCLTAVSDRPRTAVLLSQWLAVARTLVPRLVGSRLTTGAFSLIAIPAAIAWAGVALVLGGLLYDSSQIAAGIVRIDQFLAVAIPLIMVVAVIVSWRVAVHRQKIAKNHTDTPRATRLPREISPPPEFSIWAKYRRRR